MSLAIDSIRLGWVEICNDGRELANVLDRLLELGSYGYYDSIWLEKGLEGKEGKKYQKRKNPRATNGMDG